MNFLNVKHQFITAYHCQAKGAAEKFNRYIKTALRCHANSENWFEYLGLAMLGIHASYNHDIKMSCAERLFGKTLRLSRFLLGLVLTLVRLMILYFCRI